MICTFCGAENRPENKFCGMCGVRMEKRKAERRVRQDAAHLKCPSCSHINEPGYKFCGMCGGRVERRMGERRGSGTEHARATAAANAGLPTPEAPGRQRSDRPPPSQRAAATEVLPHPDRPAAVFKSEHHDHGIQGPSFLGLGDEPEDEGGYLLEDEGTSRRGLRTLVLLAVLAAIIGLVVVQWRSSFKASPRPQEAPKAEPAQRPQGSATQPAPAAPSAPSASKDPSTGRGQNVVQEDFADNGKQILNQAFGSQKGSEKKDDNRSALTEDVSTASAVRDKAAPANDENDDSDPDARSSVASGKKPSADPPQKPDNLLVKAQQYLQGSGGVRQNCDQGLIYLRAAAQKNDPAAAVQMAALYSSGHCVPQDRVMAWRWFNSAHELQPENQMVKTNMDQLWAQMTTQERRQTER